MHLLDTKNIRQYGAETGKLIYLVIFRFTETFLFWKISPIWVLSYAINDFLLLFHAKIVYYINFLYYFEALKVSLILFQNWAKKRYMAHRLISTICFVLYHILNTKNFMKFILLSAFCRIKFIHIFDTVLQCRHVTCIIYMWLKLSKRTKFSNLFKRN